MKCLEQYRSRLHTNVNRDLRVIVQTADEEAIHRFRVGVKRLTALYRMLGMAKPELRWKSRLRPARSMSRAISRVRDVHIALELIAKIPGIAADERKSMERALRLRIRKDFRAFQRLALDDNKIPLRLPTIRSLGLSGNIILRHKSEVLAQYLGRITNRRIRLNTMQWHDKRILLKRYHHTLDAFAQCPGQGRIETDLKQITMLEKLLGDWHDRVICVETLQGLELEKIPAGTIAGLNREAHILLGAARIYLGEFSRRQALT